MECYNCGAKLTKEGRCKSCGADVKTYKKILMASNSFYNEGLERANVRNLTGAVESLKKSLQYNKMNTDARNLLGLVYFEMGETVDALSEWVISKSCQKENNAASGYLDEIQNNASRLESINQTIKKYNQALNYCKQDSRDLAVIQLKKVISMNPKLVKGHQLLALLYIQEGKYEHAKKALHNAEKIDANNTITLKYQKEVKQKLRESGSKKQKKEDLISYQSGNETIIMPANFKDNSAWQTILNIIIGVALGVAISMFLLLPNIKQKSKSESNEALKAVNDTLSTKEQTISSLESQVKDLTKQAKEAKESSKGVESKMTSYEQLINAFAAYAAEDMETAGAALEQVKADDLSGNAKTVYDNVYAKVNEQYLSALYKEGYSAYTKGDYPLAIEKLLKVAELDEKYQNGNTVYYLAQSYRRSDNMEQAVVYYRKVLEQSPGTERARVAKVYVDAADKEASAGLGQGQQGAAQPEDGQPQNGQPQDGQPQDGQPQGDPNQPQ